MFIDASDSMRAGVLPTEVINCDPVKEKDIKHEQFIETGTVYAPYVPMYNTAGPNQHGFVITSEGEGVVRYYYDKNGDGDIKSLEDIEKKGLVVLDENEEDGWIDAIDSKTLADNIKRGGPLELKGIWTAELDQDIQCYHSIEAEGILVKALDKYVKKE
jgi:hypothetical protein